MEQAGEILADQTVFTVFENRCLYVDFSTDEIDLTNYDHRNGEGAGEAALQNLGLELRSRDMSGIEAIAAERQRQMNVEGWTPEHDDVHNIGQMARAAACYALEGLRTPIDAQQILWPWYDDWWEPKSRRENLVRAGALIVAEIDRLDRREKSAL